MDKLLDKAKAASAAAHAPYSRFPVGAALQGASGKIYTGCNVENASLGLTMCAERVAVGCAVAAGERAFTRLAVYTPAPNLPAPCGACRQVLREFAPDLEILVANGAGEQRRWVLSELLPHPFSEWSPDRS